MAATLQKSISPVEGNLTIPDDWDDWLPSCMGDEISNFSDDLYHDIDLNTDKDRDYDVTHQGNLTYNYSGSPENFNLSTTDQDLLPGIDGSAGEDLVVLSQVRQLRLSIQTSRLHLHTPSLRLPRTGRRTGPYRILLRVTPSLSTT